jgi:hypothetical protein
VLVETKLLLQVKTLAIRSTAEENMITRRDVLKGTDGRLPKMTEEVGMRHYIAVSLFAVGTKGMILNWLAESDIHQTPVYDALYIRRSAYRAFGR